MKRSSGRIQNVRFFSRINENRWRSNWIRVEYFQRIYVITNSSENPWWFARTEHWTWKIHRTDHLHVNVQRYWLDKKRKRWNLYFEFIKSQDIREEIFAGALGVPRSWRWKEVVWKSKVPSWRKVEFSSVSDGTAIQGNRSPSLHKCQCLESWNSENA